MNDSKTLDYWKHGQYGHALARTSMYAFGLLFGLFMIMLAWLVVAIIIMLPALTFLMDRFCAMVWGK